MIAVLATARPRAELSKAEVDKAELDDVALLAQETFMTSGPRRMPERPVPRWSAGSATSLSKENVGEPRNGAHKLRFVCLGWEHRKGRNHDRSIRIHKGACAYSCRVSMSVHGPVLRRSYFIGQSEGDVKVDSDGLQSPR